MVVRVRIVRTTGEHTGKIYAFRFIFFQILHEVELHVLHLAHHIRDEVATIQLCIGQSGQIRPTTANKFRSFR